MKLSISNLAWRHESLVDIGPKLKGVGLQGIEVAPTLEWPDAPNVPKEDLARYLDTCTGSGLQISGVQSLLFGRPELQVFQPTCWPDLYDHLEGMFFIARELGADVTVFGSPKNRIRGRIPHQDAFYTFLDFLSGLIPKLENYGVVLTLEPNASEYGADFLTNYFEVVEVCDALKSQWVKPQIDTGCMYLSKDNAVEAAKFRMPSHVHISMPNLLPPPGDIEHESLKCLLESNSYEGWAVLEMLPVKSSSIESVVESAQWFAQIYGTAQ